VLWRRLLGAALVVPPILGLFWCEAHLANRWPGAFLLPLAVAVVLAAASEFVSWLELRNLPFIPWGAPLGSGSLIVCTYLSGLSHGSIESGAMGGLLTLIAIMMLLFLFCMWQYQEPQTWLSAMAHTGFAVVYLGLPMSFLMLLRLAPPNPRGLLAVFSLLWIVKISDVGAYFVGRAWGGPRLAPKLSPAKTVAGAVGAITAGWLAAILSPLTLAAWTMPDHEPLAWGVVTGLSISVTLAGMTGDLAESLLKRDLQIKDSGNWIPGLGGAMDVLDSALFAAPVGFVWWYFGWL